MCVGSRWARHTTCIIASMLSREFCVILLLAATGISVTGDMVTSKFIEESKWPYWYLVASACGMAAIFNAIAVYCWQIELPSRSDMKWVLARSLLEDLHWCLTHAQKDRARGSTQWSLS